MITPPDRERAGEDESDRDTAMNAERVERYREEIQSSRLTLEKTKAEVGGKYGIWSACGQNA